MERKSKTASQQVRQSEILDYLKNGLSKPQICSLIKEKYGVGQSTIDKDFIIFTSLTREQDRDSFESYRSSW